MPAPYAGEEFEIGFNAEFLRDGVDSIVGDDVHVKLINPLRPGDPRGRGRRLHVPDHADQARPALIVRTVTLRDFRSYERLELELEPGLVLVTGPNGAGKTNLLESLHVGTQGFSPRTRADAQLVRFGATAARVALAGERGGRPLELEVTLQPQAGKRAKLNGAPLRVGRAAARRGRDARLHARPARRRQGRPGGAARVLRPRARPAAARAARRCRSSTRPRWASETPRCGGSRSASRPATRVAPWTEQVADARRRARRGAGARRSRCSRPPSPSARTSSGCRPRRSTTTGEPPTVGGARGAARARPRARRRPGSARTSTTSPSARASASCAAFGSQGEQRLAVLSLLLAEAEVLAERRGDAAARAARRRPLRARRGPAPDARGADRARRAGDRDGDGRGRAPARAGAAARGHAGRA